MMYRFCVAMFGVVVLGADATLVDVVGCQCFNPVFLCIPDNTITITLGVDLHAAGLEGTEGTVRCPAAPPAGQRQRPRVV